jgi:two-component system OmpR family sensor kinase/two-component system sensor histidine kinase QseC
MSKSYGNTIEIFGDEKALQSLVRNLVDNALRHTPGGSRIEVEVAADGGAVRLSVDDDGPGIPVEERERVFDRFYGRSVGDDAGSGLGLAIVKAVVERHDGRIELAQSALGGLRVAVHLPRAAGATA